MSGYAIVVAVHVFVAVLGAGQIGAIALLLARARRHQAPPPELASLLAAVRVSLGLLILSGVLLDVLAHGALHQLWWARLSFILTIVVIVLLRRAQKQLASGAGVEGLAWSMVILVGAIAVIMRAKPF